MSPWMEQYSFRETWMMYYSMRTVDWGKIWREVSKAGWFICRYGNQSRGDVLQMTMREIAEAIADLGEFIELENTPPSKGSKM